MDVIRHARPELVVPWKCPGTPSERRGDGGVGKDTGQEGRSLRGISRSAAAVRGSQDRGRHQERRPQRARGVRDKAEGRGARSFVGTAARCLEETGCRRAHSGSRSGKVRDLEARSGLEWSGNRSSEDGNGDPLVQTRLRPAGTVCFRGGATLGMWVEVRAAAAGAVSQSRRPLVEARSSSRQASSLGWVLSKG